MDEKVNFAAVGVFVIGLGAALLAAILWLAAGGAVRREVQAYQSFSSESVAGLNLNAPVKYRGVDVGRVRGIRLVPGDPQQVQLIYAIDRGTPIKTDTVATLTVQGLTGIAYVELSGGSARAPLLLPRGDGDMPVIPTRPSLTARLEQVLTRVMGSVDRTAQNLDGVFSPGNKQALATTLANLATLSQTLADRRGDIDAALRNADRTLEHAARASAELEQAIARVSRTAQTFDTLGRDLDQAASGARTTLARVDAGVQRVTDDTLPRLEQLLADLDGLSASLRRLAEQTQRNPQSLLSGNAPRAKGPGE